jgi:hypothetical protein
MGLLRLIGLLNAAIWLGGVIFFSLVGSPSVNSASMLNLLQPKNFAYFAPAIQHIALGAYFQFFIVCALIALLHLIVEWIYLGRPISRKVLLALVGGLLIYGMAGSNLLQPHLKKLHTTRYSVSAQPIEREAAARSYGRWRTTIVVLNLFSASALLFHFWRITRPSDTPRFVSSVKFRG